MRTLVDILTERCYEAVKKAFPDASGEIDITLVEVTQSTQEKFGHYQCNAAMKLARLLKQAPRSIAEKLVESIEKTHEGQSLISSLEIAGPGFINITLVKEYLSGTVQEMLLDEKYGLTTPSKQKIIVDFSGPNVAKEMHVGHLRSTIIGDSLARLFEFLGHDVLRLNHIGDWGTQFGMLIAYMKEKQPHVIDETEKATLPMLMGWYKEAKKYFDADVDFKKRSQKEVVALQAGEAPSRKIWEIIRDISRKGYQEIYDILDVKIEERGESYYNDMLPGLVAEMQEKGLAVESEGAQCVYLDGFTNRDGDPLPLMIQKSDGGYNYDTTDLTALRQRIQEEAADRILYVHDMGQRQHFEMVFAAAEKAGYYDPQRHRIDYAPFGLVLGPDGKKFKTRSGKTEKLIDLLTAAVSKAKDIMKDRESITGEVECAATAEALGIGAIKYADLSCNRVGDYSFSYDRMLRFEGNTAAFLMYSYVRIASIQRKVGLPIEEVLKKAKITLRHPSEVSLGLHLRRFAETLNAVSNDLTPNRLTEYLYDLAQCFNAFFRDCRVQGDDLQNERLLLCEITARIMKQGLDILGVKTVEKM
jgi:arginyl-tRNA synthetase